MQRNESSDSDTTSNLDSNLPNFNPSTVRLAIESDQEPHEEQPSLETSRATSSLTEEDVGRIERMSLAERISKYFESMEPYVTYDMLELRSHQRSQMRFRLISRTSKAPAFQNLLSTITHM